MKTIPDQFLMLTNEGLSKVLITTELVQNIDNILSKFTADRLTLAPRVTEHPSGWQHAATWTSNPPRQWAILELTKGLMVLNTFYEANQNYVYPCFLKTEQSVQLRCLFDFALWHAAGLRMFLGINYSSAAAHLPRIVDRCLGAAGDDPRPG